jgi:LuxR family maltose regulon positive regulatory protein
VVFEKRGYGSLNFTNFDQGLIRTKCNPPRISEQRVLRRDLLNKLAGALQCKLTIVTAPAGYGKSTTVIDWLGQTKLPVAWVAFDANDNHPEVFWRYICLALDGVLGGVSDATSYYLASPELLKTNAYLNILIDRFGTTKNKFILALDDFHFITTPEVLKNFSCLVNYLPPHVHVILISRTAPGLELAKLRLSGDLLQITLNDLRFQAEEIAQFYKVKGLAFEREELERIEQYTQGWAAALVAVAMDPEAKLNSGLSGAFSRGVRLIDQFLKEELVSKWSEAKREFLLKTAFLDSLCGPLCDAVTGLDNCSEMLRQLWLQNEFLIALDNENCWYRYHPLFRNFLRQLLDKQARLSQEELVLKAARWYQENGLIYQAIDYYLDARQFETAVELIDLQGSQLFSRGDYAKLFVWLERLPEGMIDDHPRIIAVQTRYCTENNLFDAAQKCLDRLWKIVNATSDGQNCTTDLQLKKGVLLMEAYTLICQRNLTGFQTEFQAAAAIDATQLILSQNYLDLNQSEIYLYRCRACFVDFFKLGEQSYWQTIYAYRKMIPQNPGFAPLAAAEFYYETNRLEAALPYLTAAVDEAVKADCPGALVPAMVTIARIKRAQNDITAAYDTVRECEKRLTKFNRPHWNYLLNAFRVRLDLEAGRTGAAAEWLQASKFQIYQEITRTGEYELLVVARVLISQERFGDAAILLERLLTFAETEKRLHSKVEILNLMAINTAQNSVARALELLERSLAIGLREGYFRSFVDEFAPLAALLEQYLTGAEKPGESTTDRRQTVLVYAADLLRTIRSSPFQTAFLTQERPGVRVAINCFGSFAIYQDGQPLNCKSSKARELLAYLVHNEGKPVGWEKIVEAIWPDYPYENAHVSFHSAIYLLRKFLEKYSLLDILDSSRGSYRIRPEMIECDCYELNRILTELGLGRVADLQLIAAARKLYGGGYFEEEGFGWAYARAAKLERVMAKLENQ